MNRHDSRDRSRRGSLRGSPLVYGQFLLVQLLSYQMLLLRECTGNRLTALYTRIIVHTKRFHSGSFSLKHRHNFTLQLLANSEMYKVSFTKFSRNRINPNG